MQVCMGHLTYLHPYREIVLVVDTLIHKYPYTKVIEEEGISNNILKGTCTLTSKVPATGTCRT